MKIFSFEVTVFVQGETQEEALQSLQGDLDYLCKADGNLCAVAYPDGASGEEDLG